MSQPNPSFKRDAYRRPLIQTLAIMKLLFTLFIGVFAVHSFAAEPLTFSGHDKAFQQIGAKEPYDAQFKGVVKLTGMLLVDFERDEAFFFPDEKSIPKLPSVVHGSHPRQAETISIGNGKKLLSQLFSKKAILNLLGSQHFESAAEVTLKNLRSQVVCDSREYEADWVSVSLHPDQSEVIKAGYGC